MPTAAIVNTLAAVPILLRACGKPSAVNTDGNIIAKNIPRTATYFILLKFAKQTNKPSSNIIEVKVFKSGKPGRLCRLFSSPW